MSEKQSKSATQIDEELVEFTDRILNDQPVGENSMDEELRALEAAVVQLKAAVKDAPAETAMQRIEKQLIREWNKDAHNAENQPSGWQRFLPGSRPRKSQPWPAFAFAFVVIAIFLVGLFPINQIVSSNIQGTAGSGGQYQVILLIVAAIFVLALFWFGRKKS